MALSVISTASTAFTANTGTARPTSAFTVQNGDILVAIGGDALVTGTKSMTGGSQPWNLQVQTTGDVMYMWTQVVSGDTSITPQFNRTNTNSTEWGVHVMQFRGSSGVGVNGANTSGGMPSLVLPTLSTYNSAIVLCEITYTSIPGSVTWFTNAGNCTSTFDFNTVTADWALHCGYHLNAGQANAYKVGQSSPDISIIGCSLMGLEIKGDTPTPVPSPWIGV